MLIQKVISPQKNIKPSRFNYTCVECEQKRQTERKKRKEKDARKSTFVDDGGVGKLSQAGAKSCCAI